MKVSPSIRNSTLDKIQTPTAMLKEVESGVRNTASKQKKYQKEERFNVPDLDKSMCLFAHSDHAIQTPFTFHYLQTNKNYNSTGLSQPTHNTQVYYHSTFLPHSTPSYYMVHPIMQHTLHITQYTHITQNTHIISEHYSIGMIHKISLQMHIFVLKKCSKKQTGQYFY